MILLLDVFALLGRHVQRLCALEVLEGLRVHPRLSSVRFVPDLPDVVQLQNVVLRVWDNHRC